MASNLVRRLATLVVLLSLCRVGSGDARGFGQSGPREDVSQKGSYVFATTPGDSRVSGPCRGSLFHVDGDERVLVWSRALTNGDVPQCAYVCDSGRYVVTIDKYPGVGGGPLVVYGPQGEIVAEHPWQSLGLNGDPLRGGGSVMLPPGQVPLLKGDTPKSVSASSGTFHAISWTDVSFWWEGTIPFFSPDDKAFLLRSREGKLLIVDLKSGKLAVVENKGSGWSSEDAVAKKELLDLALARTKEIVLLQLHSEKPWDRQWGARIAGEMKFDEALPRLQELLKDDATRFLWEFEGNRLELYYVRYAAKRALEAMGQNPGEVIEVRTVSSPGTLPDKGAEDR